MLGVLHAERRPRESGAFLFLDTPIDVDIAAELSAIAERVRRNIPHCRDPERFHTEKSCICQDLETLAEVFERPPRRTSLEVNRNRLRQTSMTTLHVGGRHVTM